MTQELSNKTKEAWCHQQTPPCPLTTEMGASTQTFLAIAPDSALKATNGAYYTQCQPVSPPRWSTGSQVELFNKSQEWSRLTRGV